MDPFPSHRRSGVWLTDSNYPHRLKCTMCFTSIFSPRIRRRRNTGKRTRGHPQSQCKVKRSTKWNQSYKHDVKHPVIRSNTRYTGKATPRPTTHGYPTRTCTCQISLKSFTPREGRSRRLKGEGSDCEDSSSPSHVFPQQQLQQLLLSWSDHAPLLRRRNPSTNTMNGGTYHKHCASRLNVRPR
jgi:hypothetical protein